MLINLILLLTEVIICIVGIIFMSKLFGKLGLYLWIITMTIMNVVSLNLVFDLFDIGIAVSLVGTVSIFTTSNILVQRYGKEELKNILISIFGTFLITFLIMYSSSKIGLEMVNIRANFTSNSLFNYNIMTLLGSLISIMISIFLNVELYFYIRKTINKIWISNIITSSLILYIQTLIYVSVGNLYNLEIKNLFIIILISYIVKLIISIINTYVIYYDTRREYN